MLRTALAVIIGSVVAGLMPTQAQQAQQAQPTDTTILIVTGDLPRAYEIVNGAVWVQEVTVNELRTTQGQWTHALQEALSTAMKDIRKAGGNALIRTQIQFVPRAFYVEPQRVHGGETHGLVLLYGTVVKYSQAVAH